MSKSLDAACALFIADLLGRPYALDVTIKDKSLRFIEVYAPNDHDERSDFFRRIERMTGMPSLTPR